MMLDSYMNSICLESWGRSSYARILIEIDACNGFSDNLIMVVPNHEGPGYMIETIRVKYDVQEEGQSATPLVENINMFEKQMLEGKCVLMDDDGKPLKNIAYLDDHDSEDEVEPVDNEMANFLASKPSRVGYGTKSLLEQYRETYGNAEYDYDPYDDDLYEDQEIPDHIQSIYYNLDINVRGRKKNLIT
ncbi:hypothetical protein Tco_1434113 [Tanacetum coccineum]